MISIWFFIGISLAVNGALILAAGIYQLVNPPADPGVVLFNLHAGVWWGAALLVFGLIYCSEFDAPSRGLGSRVVPDPLPRRSYFKLTDSFSGRLCEEPPTRNV